MLIRHSKTSNHFVLPTSLSTSLTMNWSVSSLHSKTKRVNALLETSLHHPLPLPCPLPTPLRLHALPASSVVDSTSRETAMKSAKHLKLQRNSCKSASLASRGRSKAKDAQDADTTTSESAQGKTAQIEFAGHASALVMSYPVPVIFFLFFPLSYLITLLYRLRSFGSRRYESPRRHHLATSTIVNWL